MMLKNQRDLFAYLRMVRPPYSEIDLSPVDMDRAYSYSHIITKASRPDLKLLPINIVIMTYEQHHIWEFQRFKVSDDPAWRWVFQMHKMLKNGTLPKNKHSF